MAKRIQRQTGWKHPKLDPQFAPAFFPKKDELATALHEMSRALCVYGGNGRCDCKYGATKATTGRADEKGPGCPEAAAAFAIVSVLSPTEFARVLRKIRRARGLFDKARAREKTSG